MPKGLLIGLGAGLVSIMLFLSAAKGTPDMLLLFCLSPLPVALAGLGWGWASAIVAAALAAGFASVLGSVRFGLTYGLGIGGPAAVIAYLALLSRDAGPPAGLPTAVDGNGQRAIGQVGHQAGAYAEWYPIGRLVLWCALWAGVVVALALLATADSIEGIRRIFEAGIERSPLVKGPGGRTLTAEQKSALALVIVKIFPWIIAASWLVLILANTWLAGHVTRVSGRLKRPWPDLSTLTLPAGTGLAFGAAVGLSLMAGMPGLIAAGFASALMFAFTLQGLAILHGITRGNAARPAILGFVYLALLVLSPLSSFVVAVVGLAEPLLRHRRPPSAPPPSMPTAVT